MSSAPPKTVAAPDPWLMPTPAMLRARDRQLAATFFLVRNDGDLGEKLRCKRCGGKHAYITSMCVEHPFDGLANGLFAFWHTVGAHGGEQYLSAEGRRIYDAVQAKLGPDFASSNPHLTGSLNIDPQDVHFGAISLGTLEPISRADAQKRVWRINSLGRRPPLSLPGLRGGL